MSASQVASAAPIPGNYRQGSRALQCFGLATVACLVVLRIASLFLEAVPSVGLNTGAAALLPLQGPDSSHLLGTDQLGRDLLLRLVVSVEAFFEPGLFACVVALLLSLPAGALMGYWPATPVARVLRGAATTIAAWPRLVLVVVGVATFTAMVSDPAAWEGLRLYVLAALVGLSFVPELAGALSERIQTLQREQFIEACRAHGIAERDILLRHILWSNCRDLVLRQVCLVFGAFILVETSLSYLGDYGVPPPRPSWGNILAGLKSSVLHSRSLLVPESWSPAAMGDAVLAAIHDGGLLGVVVPSLAITLSIGGIVALAEFLARRDAQ
jgi:peptide/nickel transport system permease protein